MGFFQMLTPISYWLLIIMWAAIMAIYLRRTMISHWQGNPFAALLIILAVDAFRTMLESIYLGAWYTSLAGLLPASVHATLVRPELVFIPKAVNLLAAVIILFLLLRRWLPLEQEAWRSREEHLAELETEVARRREVEKALKDSEARFREMTDMLPVGVAELGLDYKYTYVNQMAMDIFGYTREDIAAGLSAKDVIHPDDHARLAERIGRILEGESQAPGEYRMRHQGRPGFHRADHLPAHDKERPPDRRALGPAGYHQPQAGPGRQRAEGASGGHDRDGRSRLPRVEPALAGPWPSRWSCCASNWPTTPRPWPGSRT